MVPVYTDVCVFYLEYMFHFSSICEYKRVICFYVLILFKMSSKRSKRRRIYKNRVTTISACEDEMASTSGMVAAKVAKFSDDPLSNHMISYRPTW